jgi:hypothetical protein
MLNCLNPIKKGYRKNGRRGLLNKKGISTLVIVAIVVIIIIVAGVAVYVLYNGGGGGGTTPTPTPTSPVEGASSLAFKVNVTISGDNELHAFTAKNLGTSDILLRVDQIDAQGNVFTYLFNQTAQSLWISVGGSWMDQSTDFASYWNGANSATIGYTAFDGYKTKLATNWSGSGDYDYTSGADTFHLYDIVVNPSVADSLFEHG